MIILSNALPHDTVKYMVGGQIGTQQIECLFSGWLLVSASWPTTSSYQVVRCCCGKIDLKSIAIVILSLVSLLFKVTPYLDCSPMI